MGAIHQQAVQGGVAVAGNVGADPKRGLVGRSAELGQIRLAVRQATGGTGQAMLVTGEAGIGKTRVVAEGLDDASRLGVQVFRGAAEELERRRPFGAIADCLGIGGSPPDDRRKAIMRLLAEDVGGIGGGWFGETPQAEFRVVEAVVALVEELSTQSPVMVAVEDLQWADPSTLLVLQRLGRQVRQLPVLLVCTARPVPRSQELEGCLQGLRASGATELLLGPLDGAAATRLVEQLVGAPPGPSLLRQVAGAGGNPLFVTELVGALQRDGSIELESDGTAELTTVGIPAALPLLILHRLSFLAPATLELLQVASVLGSSFAVPDLSAVVGRPTAGLLAALEEAIAAGILESRGELLGFRHDLIWEALYQDLPAPLRRGLHLDAGRGWGATRAGGRAAGAGRLDGRPPGRGLAAAGRP
jgi:predicted ATPase